MKQIILNEWKRFLRVRLLTYLTVLFVLVLTLITWLGILQSNAQLEQQLAAREHVRKQWETLEAMNPHGAAHYGSYAFKPVSSLNGIDEGVNHITGNVLRLEGHVQNEIVYSETSQSLSVSKFGKLKPSLLLQYVIPLLLIFLAFGLVSSEKETGRLKLLVFQGAPLSKLILAKALSIWFYSLLLLTTTVLVQTALNNGDTDLLQRTFLLLLAYAAYYYVVTLFAVYLSARLRSNTAALSMLLAVWILWTIFLPKIWGHTADKFYPLPSRQEFKTAMQDDRSKGIDGHNPADKREEELKQEVLAMYKVDSLEQLPINFDGIVMQADEEYGNQVWDRHFGANNMLLQKQKKAYQLSGLFNPFASLQSVSMGFSGTDMLHHLDFLRQAENYRRNLIKRLNNEHAYGGSKTGDWNWKVDNVFFRSIKDFEYKSPSITSMSGHYFIDLLCLIAWVLLATFVVTFTANKIRLT